MLEAVDRSVGQIVVPWLMYGSGGLERQPASVVDGFVSREAFVPGYHHLKSIVRRSAAQKLRVHTHLVSAKSLLPDMQREVNVEALDTLDTRTVPIAHDYVRIHHYALMSRERFMRVEATRGDVNFRQNTHDADYFANDDKWTSLLADASIANKRVACHRARPLVAAPDNSSDYDALVLLYSSERGNQSDYDAGYFANYNKWTTARITMHLPTFKRAKRITVEPGSEAEFAEKVVTLAAGASDAKTVVLVHVGVVALTAHAAGAHFEACHERLRAGYTSCAAAEFGWLANSDLPACAGARETARALSATGVWPPGACATTSLRSEKSWARGGPLLAPTPSELRPPEARGGAVAPEPAQVTLTLRMNTRPYGLTNQLNDLVAVAFMSRLLGAHFRLPAHFHGRVANMATASAAEWVPIPLNSSFDVRATVAALEAAVSPPTARPRRRTRASSTSTSKRFRSRRGPATLRTRSSAPRPSGCGRPRTAQTASSARASSRGCSTSTARRSAASLRPTTRLRA